MLKKMLLAVSCVVIFSAASGMQHRILQIRDFSSIRTSYIYPSEWEQGTAGFFAKNISEKIHPALKEKVITPIVALIEPFLKETPISPFPKVEYSTPFHINQSVDIEYISKDCESETIKKIEPNVCNILQDLNDINTMWIQLMKECQEIDTGLKETIVSRKVWGIANFLSTSVGKPDKIQLFSQGVTDLQHLLTKNPHFLKAITSDGEFKFSLGLIAFFATDEEDQSLPTIKELKKFYDSYARGHPFSKEGALALINEAKGSENAYWFLHSYSNK